MKKFTQETLVGLFVLVGLACVAYLSVKLGNIGLGIDGQYTLKARFNSVEGLAEGSRVSMAGVKIGQVDRIHLDKENYVAIIDLRIEGDITLYDDAIASVRTNGLIGDRYVGITPGGSGVELHPGDMIIETESAVNLESLISKLAFGEASD